MPKRVKKYTTANAPPIDWLWAAVLERQRVCGTSLEDMATIAGVSYAAMRRMINKSPWSWRKSARENVCEYYGIDIGYSIGTRGKLEVNIQ